MGYYSGQGETTGGGSSVSLYESFIWYGTHNVYQRTATSTNRKAGVSLAIAQAAQGDCNMRSHRFTWGTHWYWSTNCKGTKTSVSYAQINGSNLYELVTETETIRAKLDERTAAQAHDVDFLPKWRVSGRRVRSGRNFARRAVIIGDSQNGN